ncbi:hypothetical protein T492DRAFT_890395 [Pavlovales sp. CCMP2436]|nr:hypothetical protein T492DRAFT_890395 [Pavlovales sp. CCMP2436]
MVAAEVATPVATQPKAMSPSSVTVDILYEEDLLRNAFSLKYWMRYLDAKRKTPAASRNVLFERALKHLPGSYKLWRMYMRERREQLKGQCPLGAAHAQAVLVFERALIFMHKMPRIWLEYFEFLLEVPRATHTRHAFDRALRSLPVTQHERIWPLYLRFVSQLGVTETAVRVYHRYLKYEPDGAEEYIEFLLSVGRVGEAAQRLAELLNRENFVSLRGQTRHSTWLRLCRLLSENPLQVAGKLRAEAIIRGGLREFESEVGYIWVSLADLFIRQAQFEQARDVYEEAITSVMTVRDFSLVFDAYAQYEESMITNAMDSLAELEAAAEGEAEESAAAVELAEAGADLDIRLARLERLT